MAHSSHRYDHQPTNCPQSACPCKGNHRRTITHITNVVAVQIGLCRVLVKRTIVAHVADTIIVDVHSTVARLVLPRNDGGITSIADTISVAVFLPRIRSRRTVVANAARAPHTNNRLPRAKAHAVTVNIDLHPGAPKHIDNQSCWCSQAAITEIGKSVRVFVWQVGVERYRARVAGRCRPGEPPRCFGRSRESASARVRP
jgi:hypothetical protein